MNARRWSPPILVAALLAAGTLLVSGPGPVAGSDGPCPGTTGVTVVVDYHALGGGVVVRCAPGSPATGFKALQAAGFDLVEVQNVPGFLCRIDGKPGAAQDPCLNTPPGSAYWSYWHAERGGSWVTNQQGGKTRKPPPGSVDGWSFSDDGSPGGAAPPPGIAPPAAPATPKPTAKPTPKPTARPTPAASATPAPTPKPTTDPATPRPTAEPDPDPAPSRSDVAVASTSTSSTSPPGSTLPPTGAPPPAGEPGGTPAAVPAASSSAEPAGAAPAATTSGGGPPFGTLLGLGLVALIVVLGWSRRPSRRGGDG
jgi:hypothetical protein